MITCPWCGTRYAAFQSNCKNCGGPLPAPPAPAAESAPDEAPPPPAPRPISDRYAWRLLTADGAAVTGMVFALLGGVFTLVGLGLTLGVITAFVGVPFLFMGLAFLAAGGALLSWRWQKAQTTVGVLRHGAAIRGEIAGADVNPAVVVNGRNPWTIAYRFRADGREVLGRVTTLTPPEPRLAPGRPAWVLYRPEAPEQNALYPHP